ncbi:hypothetical protein E1267_16770 [Nonomuraea longispora]|uniref:Uncharacterized protein n=1 Tax=Nonomuraea longispora TaxID=1848320 RepID=A0A4R4NB82_9ACTN|nr:Atu4866 domain-containing protein [Nonomuraea longispora]TDC06291.1 hypothetical protein E1267_16770 [Nonomuraea longispora]
MSNAPTVSTSAVSTSAVSTSAVSTSAVSTSAPKAGRRRWLLLPAALAAGLVIHAVHPQVTGHPVAGTTAQGAQPMAGPGALVVADATVHVTPSRTVRGELWAENGRITHVGPREERSSRPAGARVIEADGAYVVPLLVDSAVRAQPAHQRGHYDLTVGNPATFAVTRARASESQIRQMLMIQPRDLLAITTSGHVQAWQGRPTDPAGTSAGERRTWHGVWVDDSHELEQHLLPDGRYTETRHGRTDAYTGRYWARDDRVTYLDDTGFWAFGQMVDGVLHHSGFVMRKRPG